jgi:signal transduction histidine kinase
MGPQATISHVSEHERLAALGRAAAIFAHEGANLLNNMHLSLQLLEVELAECPELTKTRYVRPLQALKQGTKHLLTLLHEFRAISACQQCYLRPTSVAAVVNDLLATETPHYAEHSIQVEQTLPPDLPLVAADSEKLKQALLNLCKNAAEAMPQGGTLTVGAHTTDDHVYLDVSDTGVGLPEGVDVLSPFITTKPHGVGLGLTVVQQIVAAHDGTLTIERTSFIHSKRRGSRPLSVSPISPSR